MPPPASDLERILSRVFLFRQWSTADIREIAGLSLVKRFERNDLVFRHGDRCTRLYVVLDGRVQLARIRPDGREVVIHAFGPGELLACAALFLDHAYPASAQVTTPAATLLILDGVEFLDRLRRRPELSFRMIGALAARIAVLAGRIESQSSESAPQRVAAWLLDQRAVPGTNRVRLPGAKKAIAEELGMTPETFSRVLAKLRASGAIETSGREIAILRPEVLESEA